MRERERVRVREAAIAKPNGIETGLLARVAGCAVENRRGIADPQPPAAQC